MSDAELLRRAAALMRRRAEDAGGKDPEVDWYQDGDLLFDHTDTDADAEHIASWSPAVAFAVADWLDSEALLWEQADNLPDLAPLELRVTLSNREESLAVARAYLAEPAGQVDG